MTNLVQRCLTDTAAEYPSRTALILLDGKGGKERFSFGLLDDMVRRTAGGLLELGLPPASPIFLQTGNSLDSIVLSMAAMAAGLVATPLSSSLTAREIEKLAAMVRPRLYFGPGDKKPEDVPLGPSQRALQSLNASPIVERAADDPSYLLFTSGTGGVARAVLHGHRVYDGRAPLRKHWLNLDSDDVVLHAGDFNWSYTFGVGLMDPWAEGATAVLYSGEKSPEIWPELIVDCGATIFASVPALYRRILKYGDLSRLGEGRLQHAVTAGEALPVELHQQWLAATGVPLYEALGMTECSTFISSGPDVPVVPGSPGKIQEGRRVAVLKERGEGFAAVDEVGMLAVHRSEPGLMLDYFEAWEARGRRLDRAAWRGDWFITGDLVAQDREGYIWHQGRADDILNVSGYRVSPLEIEGVLEQHPWVAEAAVSLQSIKSGVDGLVAAVVMDARASCTAEQLPALLAEFLGRRLAAHKQPHRYMLVTELPRNRNGKLMRRQLAAMIGRDNLQIHNQQFKES